MKGKVGIGLEREERGNEKEHYDVPAFRARMQIHKSVYTLQSWGYPTS